MTRVAPFALAVAAAIGGWSSQSAQGEDLEAVQKRIVELCARVKSFTAEMKMNADQEAGGVKRTQDGAGKIEFQRKGDKQLMRAEVKMNIVQNLGGQEQKMEQSVLQVSDGEFMYFLQESAGAPKQAVKMKAESTQSNMADKAMFDNLSKENELKLLPDEKLDGRDVFVIEALPKQPNPSGVAKATIYFSKEFGMVLKQVAAGADGKALQTVAFTNVKIDPEIAADRFVFTAPEGVEVMDMTKGAGQPEQP